MIEIALPSGRTDVILNHLNVAHLTPLYNAQHYSLAHTFIKTIQQVINVDLMQMYLEDFRYLLAMIDKISWTQGHRVFEWRCTNPYYVTYDNQRHYEVPRGRRFKQVDCNSLNTEEISNMRVVNNKWKKLPTGMVHPTVARWIQAQDACETIGDIAFDVMWIDSDLSIEETLDAVPYRDILEVRAHKYSICECVSNFKCNICLRKYENRQPLELLNFLRVYSETSIMNMTHDLAVHRKILVPDDMTVKKLFYWHGLLLKDLQHAAEERAKRNSKNRRNKR